MARTTASSSSALCKGGFQLRAPRRQWPRRRHQHAATKITKALRQHTSAGDGRHGTDIARKTTAANVLSSLNLRQNTAARLANGLPSHGRACSLRRSSNRNKHKRRDAFLSSLANGKKRAIIALTLFCEPLPRVSSKSHLRYTLSKTIFIPPRLCSQELLGLM